jgi:hypothetical protein
VFVRVKRVREYEYLQVVENHREGRKTKQRVVASLGRLDRLREEGRIDAILKSLGRYGNEARVQQAHVHGELEAVSSLSIGPALIFERLWDELGIGSILRGLLEGCGFEFDVERAVFSAESSRGSSKQGLTGRLCAGWRALGFRVAKVSSCTTCTGPCGGLDR